MHKYMKYDVVTNDSSGELFLITEIISGYYHFAYLIPCANKDVSLPFAFVSNVNDYMLIEIFDNDDRLNLVNF